MKNYKYKEYLANTAPCAFYGILCGAVCGLFIFLFKYCASLIEKCSHWIYTSAKESPLYIAAVFAGLIAFALIMCFIHKKIPESKGGGIPRSEGVLRGILSFRSIKTLFATFFGSMISFLCGLPLGSEGPAVLMGTALGDVCAKTAKNRSAWSRYIMTGGAAAGFSVATGSPLTGILFALEEIHKRFTPMLVLTVSVSVLSATYVNRLLCSIFGINAFLFEFEAFPSFQLGHIGYILVLALIVAVFVGVFDASVSFFGRITAKFKFFTAQIKMVCLFLIAGVMCFYFTEGVYSGHHVIENLTVNDKSIIFIGIILVIRMVMMLFVTDSGATGGIFIPTLAIGATAGALASKLLILLGMPDEFFAATVLLGMCAFIGGTLRAPITATVLFLELTNQYTNLFFVALAVFSVTYITQIFNQTPFYDSALEKMEHTENGGKQPIIARFEMKISHGAFVVGKAVRDIMWPTASVVVSVTNEGETKKDMDNDGEKILCAEDTIVLRARYFDEDDIKQMLKSLVGSDFEIIKL